MDSGFLRLYIGPMFSGKTTRMLADLAQMADTGLKVLFINHIDDQRGSPSSKNIASEKSDSKDFASTAVETAVSTSSKEVEKSRELSKIENPFSTHSSHSMKLSTKFHTIKVKLLSELQNNHIKIDDYQVIGVDESQFFTDLEEVVTIWLEQRKIVYCAGLNSDAFMRPFGQILRLGAMAEEIIHLRSRCVDCISEFKQLNPMNLHAHFSALITSEVFTQKLIGGADKYVAVCRHHFILRRTQLKQASSHSMVSKS